MKKSTLIFVGIALATLLLSSCGNSDKQSETNSSNTKDTKQVNEKKVSDLLTQQGFEKMIAGYGISLYPNIKFKEIKEKNNGDIMITYIVPDKSEESHQKLKEYIANEFSKLEKNGWGTMPTMTGGIAMKKEGNKKIAIQINEAFYKPGNLHELAVSFGAVE